MRRGKMRLAEKVALIRATEETVVRILSAL